MSQYTPLTINTLYPDGIVSIQLEHYSNLIMMNEIVYDFRMTNAYAASYWHTLFRYICMYTFNVYTIKCTINFYTINVYTIKNMINVCTLKYMINVYMMIYKVILNAINYTIKVNAIKDMIFVDLLLYNHKMINSSTIWISSLLHGTL